MIHLPIYYGTKEMPNEVKPYLADRETKELIEAAILEAWRF